MTYYIGESGSAGRKFSSRQEFIDAIMDLADKYESEGEDWFEIEIVRD